MDKCVLDLPWFGFEMTLFSGISVKQLIRTIIDLNSAGTETTTNTLIWNIIYLLHHPDVMEKVQEEIDRVLGRNKTPSMKDKQSLPYVEATILEVERLATVLALGVPHTVLEDVEFKGYTIPKGTTVISNLYAAHRDERTWDEPDEFQPCRFLDENGQIVRREELIPFSIGKNLFLL